MICHQPLKEDRDHILNSCWRNVWTIFFIPFERLCGVTSCFVNRNRDLAFVWPYDIWGYVLHSITFRNFRHYNDVIMSTIVYSSVYLGKKHQSSVNYPHKWPVTRKMFRFDDVIMVVLVLLCIYHQPAVDSCELFTHMHNLQSRVIDTAAMPIPWCQ